MVDIQPAMAEILGAEEKEDRKKEETTG